MLPCVAMTRPFRLESLLLAAAAALLVGGCGKRPASPETVYRQFFDSMVKYSRQPFPLHQKSAHDLLSRSSQERLSKDAEAVNATLPEGMPRLNPFELLVTRRARLGTAIRSVVVANDTPDRVVLEVTYDQGVDRVTLVMEGGVWRVDLFPEAGADAPPSAAPRAPSPDSA